MTSHRKEASLYCHFHWCYRTCTTVSPHNFLPPHLQTHPHTHATMVHWSPLSTMYTAARSLQRVTTDNSFPQSTSMIMRFLRYGCKNGRCLHLKICPKITISSITLQNGLYRDLCDPLPNEVVNFFLRSNACHFLKIWIER